MSLDINDMYLSIKWLVAGAGCRRHIGFEGMVTQGIALYICSTYGRVVLMINSS